MTLIASRRDLLAGALAGAGLLALRPIRSARAQQPHDMDPPAGAALGRRARIAPQGEPGQPMAVRGTVFASDGRTPAAGVTVYAYQTDAAGIYGPSGSPPRLRGWMVTDAAGRYELASIRPAPYPGRTIPAHVHFNAWGPDHPRQWFEQLEFEGDRLLTAERIAASGRLGRFGAVRPLRREQDGVWSCTFDMRLLDRSNY